MRNFFLLPLIIFTFFVQNGEATVSPPKTSGIVWMANYEQAVKLSKHTKKPLFLFFTGSDWCGWCNKLEKEILETQEFIQVTNDKLIFVKLDYPMRSQLDPETTTQNEHLKEKFSVRSFPSIVIVDVDQQPIGISGYRSGGGKQYALHILKMVSDYTAYRQQMQRLGSHQLSGKDLKRLYQKARELGLEADANLLIRKGIASDQSIFFLTERYRHLVISGQIQDKETLALKRKLLESDPNNKLLTHYQVAVIDFEAYSEEGHKASLSPPETAIAPLLDYIAKFGEQDKENLWRLQMVISQVYLDKNRYEEALKFAQDSYTSAPTTVKSDIALAIKNIESQIDTLGH